VSKITKLALVALALSIPARYCIIPSPSDEEETVARVKTRIDQLAPLHQPLGKPQPGDWLVKHPEPGQTFA
jgi:archaemetzincin